MAKKENQKKFVAAYKKYYGNITKACIAADIERSTYYLWKNSTSEADLKFKAELEAVEPDEQFLDFVENKFAAQISRGNITAIIFALKTKGKARGYVEKIEIEQSGTVKVEQQNQDLSNLSDEELLTLKAIQEKLKNAA